MAQLMDRLGYDTFWMAEHHFQHEGYECIPNVLMTALHLAHVTERLRIGCGFNITPMWHPAAARRRLRDGRHPERRAHHVRRRARLSHPRGRDLRLAVARPAGQPRIVRRTGRHHLQGVQQRILLAPGQALHSAAAGALSRLYARRTDRRAAAVAAAGRMLAADPGRQRAGARFHGEARHPRSDRRRLGRGRGDAQGRARLASRRMPASASTSNSASGCASASISTSPTAAKQGIREAGKYYEENMKMFGELRLVRALSDEQIEIMRDPKRAPSAKLPRIEDAIAAGGVLCGSPDQIIEHLKALEKRYPGLDRVSVSLSVGVPKGGGARTARTLWQGGHAGLRQGQDAGTGAGAIAGCGLSGYGQGSCGGRGDGRLRSRSWGSDQGCPNDKRSGSGQRRSPNDPSARRSRLNYRGPRPSRICPSAQISGTPSGRGATGRGWRHRGPSLPR